MQYNLKLLKAKKFPRATCKNVGLIFTIKKTNKNLLKAKIQKKKLFNLWNKYFYQFISPNNSIICPICGVPWTGELSSLRKDHIMPEEANCGSCGYPCRIHHNLKTGGILNNFPLAYHPSQLPVKIMVNNTALFPPNKNKSN